MGARLWSQRRSSRASRPPPPPSPQQQQQQQQSPPPQPQQQQQQQQEQQQHHHHSQTTAILTPKNTFTHSVLYVCEGMSGSVGEAMAAARDRATRYQSVQQDTTLGYPYQVAMPDGEEKHCTLPSMKHFASSDSQEAEITREYLKPPPNKTLFDVEGEGPLRSCSMGTLTTHGEWGMVQGGMHQHQHYHHHRQHSASLDARPIPHPAVYAASSSSSSSSSSWTGLGSGEDSSRGSPRRLRKTGGGLGQRGSQLFANCIAPFTSPKNERAPQLSQDGSRRGGRHQGLVTGSLLPSSHHDPNVPLPFHPAASTLADITMVSVPCGSSNNTPSYPSGGSVGASSQGTQGGTLPLSSYEQSSQSVCSTTSADVLPPLYSEVIENPTLYRSVSRPSEQRTNSGKI